MKHINIYFPYNRKKCERNRVVHLSAHKFCSHHSCFAYFSIGFVLLLIFFFLFHIHIDFDCLTTWALNMCFVATALPLFTLYEQTNFWSKRKTFFFLLKNRNKVTQRRGMCSGCLLAEDSLPFVREHVPYAYVTLPPKMHYQQLQIIP